MPQLLHMLWRDMAAGCALVQNLPNQRDLMLRQSVDLPKGVTGVECRNRGRHSVEVDLLQRGIVSIQRGAGATRDPDGYGNGDKQRQGGEQNRV